MSFGAGAVLDDEVHLLDAFALVDAVVLPELGRGDVLLMHAGFLVSADHGDIINTGSEHLSLLQRVNHKSCGALVDTGKYLTADPYADFALMAPSAIGRSRRRWAAA